MFASHICCVNCLSKEKKECTLQFQCKNWFSPKVFSEVHVLLVLVDGVPSVTAVFVKCAFLKPVCILSN